MTTWGIVLVVIIALLFLYVIVSLIFTAFVCKKMFWVRGSDPDNPCYLREEDYPELQKEDYVVGYYGRAIRGYIYSDKNISQYKGFIILSHGFFGTHIQYLLDISWLTKNGYKVLAYDQFGNGISDGKNQDNLSVGVYVLENVLRNVIKHDVNAGLPLYLYGHSWGGYSVSGALKHYPQVKKAIVRSGFTSPIQAGLSLLKQKKPVLTLLFTPGIYLSYLILFGRKGFTKGTRGLKRNHKTQVLYIYASDDPMVLPSNSLAVYYQKHPKSIATVHISENGLHNSLLTIESQNRYHELVKEYQNILKIEDEDERKKVEKEFLHQLNRRNEYQLNEEVADDILAFLND